ncbi:unnamed protein product [Cuscuta campestris]|uniref:PWWP domain-containing protein n=1 Tax=Cuscuta campestris TaxID=132261 RepID=A0A484NLW3_9ASTE|nr:unnamed protein product [Cuscuta campestris]
MEPEKTDEPLTFGFSEPNTPKILGLVPMLDESTGYLKSVPNVESFPVDAADGYMENRPLAEGLREPAMELGFTKSGENKEGGAEKEADHCMVKDSYSVGDFVWGQVKWRPWWPGRIYDPSNASEFALKYRQPGRLLVVYFGDSSFSWCLPSQLKPFAESFEEMSGQSGVKSFLNAVEKSLAEIGTLLELEMSTCKCRPLAGNAGIKARVLVPNCDTRKLSLPRYEARLVLVMLRNLAQAISLPKMETVVLTKWLSAFYRAKGGYPLCCFREPKPIEGLEDMSTFLASDTIDLNAAIVQVPIIKCPVIADNKVYCRRKEKRNPMAIADDKSLKKMKAMAIGCREDGSLDNLKVPNKEEHERSPLPRKRKKSKHLSFPYTSSEIGSTLVLRPCSDAPLMAPNPEPVLPSDSGYEDILLFGSIKRNITVLKCMLKKRRGIISQEEKVYLETELKLLLEMVRTMVAAP